MKTPRQSPLEVARRCWAVVRRRWAPLLVVALGITAVSDLLAEGQTLFIFAHWTAGSWTSVPYSWLLVWLNGIRWMLIASITASDVQGAWNGMDVILRRVIARSWAWLWVALILEIVKLGATLAFMSPALILTDVMQSPWLGRAIPWLFHWSPFNLLSACLTQAERAALAYIAFAPLALIIENAPIGSALAVSWSRVRGNWTWVCATAVLLWIPHGLASWILRLAREPLSPSFGKISTIAVVKSFLLDPTWCFLLVGMSLVYLELAAREPAESVPLSE